jgi:hypothetical protein
MVYNRETIIEKNATLSFEFERYMLEHPAMPEQIPDGAEVVLLPKDDPELYRLNLKAASAHQTFANGFCAASRRLRSNKITSIGNLLRLGIRDMEQEIERLRALGRCIMNITALLNALRHEAQSRAYIGRIWDCRRNFAGGADSFHPADTCTCLPVQMFVVIPRTGI